jgi:hypothetical protein
MIIPCVAACRNRVLAVLFLVAAFFPFNSFAQPKDSLSLIHSPRRATLLSAVLPGAGQVYNHKFWKVPVIYAGFAGLGYLVKTNNDQYKIYKDAYRFRLDDDPLTIDNFTDIYSDQDLVTLKNYYRRNRDVSIIAGGVLYILNIVDAAVDAHLFYFNVNDDLSMIVLPGYSQGATAGPSISINLHF